MRERLSNQKIILILVGIGFLGFLLFNESFRNTVLRTRAIRSTQMELNKVSKEVEQMRAKIATLEHSPQAREDLVRKDLGYLRPGEKEIRFYSPSKKESDK
jgi:cell division protein FtsB